MAGVFVVDRKALFGGDWPQGFTALDASAGEQLLEQAFAAGRFEDRETAERTPAWKQWIPYCVIRCAPGATHGEQAGPKHLSDGVFRVRRSKGQSESRLHGLWSIGLGGHVDPGDAPAASRGLTAPGQAFFASALNRELREELTIQPGCPGEPRFVGLLNDDGSAVGQVHAGLVYVWHLPLRLDDARHFVQVREISKMDGGFGSLVEFRELWQDPLQFESWSQYLVHAGVAGPMGASVDRQAAVGQTRRAATSRHDTHDQTR